ncbi:MAG: DUF4342 domain-containing protein [Bacteroidetes bacterium]|nr:DUF4342 domain-containing protein [Bacteroidota bacterium]MBU2505876.1 DUF4342 domain-containing protein [Bacteroidota bacterium]
MEFKVKGQELLKKIEELIRQGNVRRIIIKDSNGKTFIEIPLTFGVIGVLAAPVVTAIAALAGAVANFTIEIIKNDDIKDADFVEVKED